MVVQVDSLGVSVFIVVEWTICGDGVVACICIVHVLCNGSLGGNAKTLCCGGAW